MFGTARPFDRHTNGSVSPVLVVGTVVLCIGELLHIVGLATPNWMEAKFGNLHEGLFQFCGLGSCVDFDDPTSELEVVQAMTIIAMLCGLAAVGGALVFVIFKITGKSAPATFLMASAGAGVAAFVFILIGVIVYAAKIYDDAKIFYDLGFSFGLCITGGILLISGGITSFVGGKSSAD